MQHSNPNPNSADPGLDRGKSVSRQRDEKGRFLKGCPAGPGRPPLATERQYLEAILDHCTPDDLAAITKRAVADAKAGDSKAREWLSKYAVPQPEAFQVVLQDIRNKDSLPLESSRRHPLYESDHATLAAAMSELVKLGFLPAPNPQNPADIAMLPFFTTETIDPNIIDVDPFDDEDVASARSLNGQSNGFPHQ